MFYRPQRPETGVMWDTWAYFHQGTYYLYYLAKSTPGAWDNVSLATSSDGANWREHGVILTKDADAVWMGTGSTWAAPGRPGKFYINFSQERGRQQTIFLAESDDLVHWRRLPDERQFRPDARWYEVDKGNASRWDCIFTVPRDEGGLWGYWTASPTGRHGVGFGRSADGLAWEALAPPVFEPALPAACEHGGVARVGTKYYHMIGISGAMYTYVAEKPEGPLVRAKVNAELLGAGVADQGWGKMYTYFARFFPSPAGLLVSHHAIGRDGMVYAGQLKRAAIDAEGTMRLAWWEGNEALKGKALAVSPAGAGPGARMLGGTLDTEGGIVLEGSVTLPRDGRMPEGVYIETAAGTGTGIFVGPGGVTDLGPIRADGTGFLAESRVNRQWAFGAKAKFRLLLKRDLVEFYLDDLLMQCYSLPTAATGRVGVFGEAGEVRAWEGRR